jgi:branched-chain amino acid transport system ATP-binding protein
MSDVVLRTEHLVKRFGGINATNDVSMTVSARRAPRADRPQRRRQDHADQPADRRAARRRAACCCAARTSRRCRRTSASALGLVRTFQINQLFGSLTPLQSLALAVSSRLDAAHRWWQPMGHDDAIAAECERCWRSSA